MPIVRPPVLTSTPFGRCVGHGTEVPAAWFASGLRVIDIANPLPMKQVAWWMPDVPPGAKRVCSNDVYEDGRGLIYLIDRNRGLSILERG